MNDSRPRPACRASRLRSRGDSCLGSDSVMGPSDPAMNMSERRTTSRRRIVLAATVLGYPDLRRGIRPARSPTRCAGACLAAIRSSGSSRRWATYGMAGQIATRGAAPIQADPPVGGAACLVEEVWQAALAHRAATRQRGVLARPSLRGRDHPPSGPPSVDPVPLGCPPSPPTVTLPTGDL